MSRGGADLALLLLGGFRFMAEEATIRLASRGHPGVRPAHDFAMRAIASGAESVSEVGRRTSVTKQAAAKTVAFLEEGAYVLRSPDPGDGRRVRLGVTDRGRALMREGEDVFDELRGEWEALVGRERVSDLQDALSRLLGTGDVTALAQGVLGQADDAPSTS
ncbi:MarR family winged helix-turn-helix transcriptional regulator [Microlunatus antarcticus]